MANERKALGMNSRAEGFHPLLGAFYITTYYAGDDCPKTEDGLCITSRSEGVSEAELAFAVEGTGDSGYYAEFHDPLAACALFESVGRNYRVVLTASHPDAGRVCIAKSRG